MGGRCGGVRGRLGGLLMLAVAHVAAPAAEASDPTTVRIVGSAWVGDGPTKVADRLGLFNRVREPGAPVIEVQGLGSGLEAVHSLLRGEAEFALAAATPVALALVGALDPDTQPRAGGIVVLASVALSNQTHRVVALPQRNLRSPNDLAGHRVAIMAGSSSHFGWWHFSTFHGLDVTAIELVDMPVTEMAAALLDGRVDAALTWDPWDRILRAQTGSDLVEFPLRMLDTVNWLLIADRDFAVAHPEITDRVLQAYLDAMAFMDASPDVALRLHAEAAGLPEDELGASTEGIIWRLGMNWSVLMSLGSQFEWLATWPELAGRSIPQPSDYLLAEPLTRVAPRLVTVPRYLVAPHGTPERTE